MITELRPGTGIYIQSDSERLIRAITSEDWASLTSAEFESYREGMKAANGGKGPYPQSWYHKAVRLIRDGETSAAAIARALCTDGPNGAEGNVWALFDLANATRQAQRVLKESEATDRVIGTDMQDGKLVMRTSVRPEGVAFEIPVSPARAPITATRGRLVFLAQVHGREVLRWTRSGAPVHSYRRDEPVFDLEALVAWMDRVEGSLDDKRRVGRGRPQIGDLIGPRRRLIAAVNRFREKELEIQDGQAKDKAIKAAALLDGAAAQIGWSGIEALTGLRHVPRAGRAA